MSARKAPRRPTRARQLELNRRAKELVAQMRNTPTAVSMTLKLGKHWRKGLPYIAGAAFSDAFAGFCAVYLLRNGRASVNHMATAFFRAMRAELESRESGRARKGGAK